MLRLDFLRNQKMDLGLKYDDGSDDQNKVGYIKGLMVVIFRNE